MPSLQGQRLLEQETLLRMLREKVVRDDLAGNAGRAFNIAQGALAYLSARRLGQDPSPYECGPLLEDVLLLIRQFTQGEAERDWLLAEFCKQTVFHALFFFHTQFHREQEGCFSPEA
ncbi:MAG: hypothetical protein HY482_02825 [Candidatus Wildermuthbacteria bacterium]|nr:hypothetical protein [Candidatus Wildermuthbacteria bacterium]